MKRIRKENKNTPEYWDMVYGNEISKGIRREDIDRFKIVGDEIPIGSKVLDIGCGKGEFFEYLKPINYTGVDISKKVIEYDNDNFSKGSFIRYNGKQLPFHDESFDVVVFMEVLEHVDDIGGFIKEAKRVLRKGGKIVGTVPFELKIKSAEHVWEFGLSDIKKILGKAVRVGNLIKFVWSGQAKE